MTVASIYENGGIIGQTLDLGSTERYIAGSTLGTPSFVGATSRQESNIISVSISGLQEGDLLVLFAAADGSARTITEPSGWTTEVVTRSNSVGHIVAHKVMGATVDSFVRFSGDYDSIVLCAFRDVEFESLSAVVTAFGNTINPPSVSTVDDNSIVLALTGLDDDTSTISTGPTGYTEGEAQAGDRASAALYYKTGVATGSEDPSAFTWSSSDAIIAYTAVLTRKSVTAFGNFKNSGIWNLDAVYNLLKPDPIPASLVTTNLILHLDAGDTNSYSGSGTTWSDLTTEGNDATLVNGPTFTDPYIDFDGVDDEATLGTIATNNALQLSSPAGTGLTITFAVWRDASGDSFQRVIDKSNGSFAAEGWAIYLDSGINDELILQTDGASQTRRTLSTSSPILSAGEWNIFTITWNQTSGNWYWYKNGSVDTSGTTPYTMANTETDARIANWNSGTGRNWHGRIGFIMVHETELSSSEVANNYNYYKTAYGLS